MEQAQSKAKKVKRWFIIGSLIFGFAILLFVVLFFFADWLQSKLEKMVAKQSKGVYELKLYGLDVSPFLGNVSTDSLTLIPDYDRWKAIHQNGDAAPRTLLDLRTDDVEISGLNVIGILFGESVQVDKLKLNAPTLKFTLMHSDTTESHKPPHETVKGLLKGLSIGSIEIDKANLNYKNKPETDVVMFTAEYFALNVKDFKLDSQSFYDPEKAYYAKYMKLHTGKLKYLMPDGLYKVESDSLDIETDKGNAVLRQIKFAPLTSPGKMAQAKGKAVSYTKAYIELVKLTDIDFHAHSEKNNLLIGHILLQNPTYAAFKDKKNFKEKGRKELPHKMVQQLKTKFKVDVIQLKNGHVRYEEIVAKGSELGYITVNNLNIKGNNITNIPEYISDKNPAVVKASMMIMNKAPLSLTIKLPLLNKKGYHTISGTIGSADPAILNLILIPTAFIKVKRGHISKGNFSVQLNEHAATGKMQVFYQDLEVEMVKKGEGGKQGLGKKILSEIADWVAIKDSNPKKVKNPESVKLQ